MSQESEEINKFNEIFDLVGKRSDETLYSLLHKSMRFKNDNLDKLEIFLMEYLLLTKNEHVKNLYLRYIEDKINFSYIELEKIQVKIKNIERIIIGLLLTNDKLLEENIPAQNLLTLIRKVAMSNKKLENEDEDIKEIKKLIFRLITITPRYVRENEIKQKYLNGFVIAKYEEMPQNQKLICKSLFYVKQIDEKCIKSIFRVLIFDVKFEIFNKTGEKINKMKIAMISYFLNNQKIIDSDGEIVLDYENLSINERINKIKSLEEENDKKRETLYKIKYKLKNPSFLDSKPFRNNLCFDILYNDVFRRIEINNEKIYNSLNLKNKLIINSISKQLNMDRQKAIILFDMIDGNTSNCILNFDEELD
jgi:hypothetical protein